jgi:hypothetical protein
VSFATADGQPAHTMAPHTVCVLRARVRCTADAPPCAFSFDFERTRDLFYCYGLNVEDIGVERRAYRAGEVVTVEFRFTAHFARGHYRVNLNLRDSSHMRFYLFAENVANFTIVEESSYGGVVDIEPRCQLLPVEGPETVDSRS